MIIDWKPFVFALVLLWLPRRALRLGKRFAKSRRRRSQHGKALDVDPSRTREPGEQTVRFQTEFGKVRNYVDFLRAGLGSFILLGTFPFDEPALRAADNATANMALTAFYARLAVFVIAVMIQSFRFENRITMFAPIFFITGLSVGMCGPYAAGFTLVLVWTVNLALPSPMAFLSIYSLVILLFGTMFLGVGTLLPLYMAILSFLPVLVSLLIRRPLVLFAKKIKSSGPVVTS